MAVIRPTTRTKILDFCPMFPHIPTKIEADVLGVIAGHELPENITFYHYDELLDQSYLAHRDGRDLLVTLLSVDGTWFATTAYFMEYEGESFSYGRNVTGFPSTFPELVELFEDLDMNFDERCPDTTGGSRRQYHCTLGHRYLVEVEGCTRMDDPCAPSSNNASADVGTEPDADVGEEDGEELDGGVVPDAP